MNDKKMRVWLVGATRVIVFFLLVVVVATHPYRTSASTGDFEIIDGMLIYYRGVGGTVIIPDGVTTIYESAFRDCTGVTSIELPEGITSIERRAFAGCSNLTSIDIPASVINIELGAFSYCENLSRITVNSKNQKYDSRNDCNAIIESQSNTLIAGCSNTVIPEGVSSIATFAFEGSKQLDVIDIPEDVKNIGDSAFYQCSNLTRITLPQVMSSIGGGAFAYCTSLLEVRIPEGITSIEPSTFSMCTKLMKVSLPSSLRSIGAVAFSDCCSLTSVDIPDGVTSLGWEAFISCNNLLYISLPATIKTFDVRAIGCDSNTRLKRIIYFKGYYDEWEKLLNRVSQLKEYKEQVVCFLGNDGVIDLGKDWINKQLSCWYVGKNVTAAFSSWKSDNTLVPVSNTGRLTNKTNGAACTAHITTSIGPLTQTITVTSDKKPNVYVQDIVIHMYGEELSIPTCSPISVDFTVLPLDATNTIVDIIPEDVDMVKVIENNSYSKNQTKTFAIEAVKAGRTKLNFISRDGRCQRQISLNIYQRDEGAELEGRKYNFSEKWFEGERTSKPNDDFNKELAKFCSYFCMYGYREVNKLGADGHKKGDVDELEVQLKKFGFRLLDYNLDSIHFEKDSDKVKYFIACRDSRDIGGKVYVFAGFIGSYGYQWKSNFDPVGLMSHQNKPKWGENPIVHSGFNDAREFVEDRLIEQIEKLKKDGGCSKEDLVCIFTGHSRGAATANLVAADFIRGERINDGNKRLTLPYTIPDNVYAYTFATPNNIYKKANENHYWENDTLYSRIYNIVNPEDFVTYMIPEAWGYTKYGTTYSFPTQADSTVYKQFISKVKQYFTDNRITVSKQERYVSFGELVVKNPDTEYNSYHGDKTVKEFVAEMVDKCTSIYDLYEKKDYTYFYLAGSEIGKEINLSVYEYFQSVLCPFAYHGDWDGINLTKGIYMPGKPTLFFGWNEAAMGLVKWDGLFAEAHEMETYDAFLNAFPTYALKQSTGTMSRYAAYCPVDIEVVENDTNDVVAKIVNNVVDETIAKKDNALFAFVKGDSKVVYIPDESQYTIRVVGNGEGTLDIVKTTYDSTGNEVGRKHSYGILVSDQYEMEYAQNYGEDGEAIENRYVVNEYGQIAAELMEVEKTMFTVDAKIEGAGAVYGAGEYANADYASVTAEPEEGWHWIGWYEDDVLVSSDMKYYFLVKGETTLEARFACDHDMTTLHPEVLATCTTDGSENYWSCERCGECFKDEECTEAVEEADLIREATGHTYCDQVTKKPSYMLNGICTYTCTKCTDSYEETIPRLDLPFTDVKKTGWQASTVRFMLDNLLMSGVSATKFAPDSVMNRGQLVAILWNMEGKPKVSGTLAFTDVPTTNTFYKAILWASQNKVINGYANGTFGPKDSLTRQQIATILMNYAKYRGVTLENNADLSTFKDAANVSKAMVTSMQWAVGNKIISGKSSGTLLDPKGMATRIEVAAMVMNYCKNIT